MQEATVMNCHRPTRSHHLHHFPNLPRIPNWQRPIPHPPPPPPPPGLGPRPGPLPVWTCHGCLWRPPCCLRHKRSIACPSRANWTSPGPHLSWSRGTGPHARAPGQHEFRSAPHGRPGHRNFGTRAPPLPRRAARRRRDPNSQSCRARWYGAPAHHHHPWCRHRSGHAAQAGVCLPRVRATAPLPPHRCWPGSRLGPRGAHPPPPPGGG